MSSPGRMARFSGTSSAAVRGSDGSVTRPACGLPAGRLQAVNERHQLRDALRELHLLHHPAETLFHILQNEIDAPGQPGEGLRLDRHVLVRAEDEPPVPHLPGLAVQGVCVRHALEAEGEGRFRYIVEPLSGGRGEWIMRLTITGPATPYQERAGDWRGILRACGCLFGKGGARVQSG